MPIELNCKTCGERLRVADTHAGKRARCPKCQGINEIPASVTTEIAPQLTSMSVAPTTFSENLSEKWHLKLEDGRTFGPVDKSELDRWQSEGRITPRSQVMNERRNTWQWAGEVYAALGVPQTTQAMPLSGTGGMSVGANVGGANPFSETAVNPYNPYSPPGVNYPRASWQKPHRGGLILAFGLLGLLVCFIFSPIALIMGHSDLGEMKRGIMDREGHGLTIAGVVMGWIVMVPTLLFLMFFMVAIVAGAAS